MDQLQSVALTPIQRTKCI